MAKMSMGRSPTAMNQQSPVPPQTSPQAGGTGQGLARVLGAGGSSPGVDALISAMMDPKTLSALGKVM